MNDKIKFRHKIRIKEYTKPPEINEKVIPVDLIEKCFSDDENVTNLSLKDLFIYLYSLDSDDEFESFCKVFPYDKFLELITSLPSNIFEPSLTRQTALLIFSDCSRSDFFPSEKYSSNEELVAFFFSLIDSPSNEESSSALQILSEMMLKNPSVCQFLVEEQELHQKLELIEATPFLSKFLAVLCDVHPESLELTLKLIPNCLQVKDDLTILHSLLAMKSALKNCPECAPVIINFIGQYSKNLFSFDIDNIEECGPYPDKVIITSSNDNKKPENDEENIQILLEIISMIPEAPSSFLTYMVYFLMKCEIDDTILLINFVLRKHKESWRGDLITDFFICSILQGMMKNFPYELRKSCFQTILVYYQWENEFNEELTSELIHFIEDKDIRSACLFILCDLIEVFIIKKSAQESSENLAKLLQLLETAIPSVERIISDSNESEVDSSLAQKFIDILPKK